MHFEWQNIYWFDQYLLHTKTSVPPKCRESPFYITCPLGREFFGKVDSPNKELILWNFITVVFSFKSQHNVNIYLPGCWFYLIKNHLQLSSCCNMSHVILKLTPWVNLETARFLLRANFTCPAVFDQLRKQTVFTVSLQHLSPMQIFLNGLNFLHMGKLFWQLPLIVCVVLVIRWHFLIRVLPLCSQVRHCTAWTVRQGYLLGPAFSLSMSPACRSAECRPDNLGPCVNNS